MKGDCYKGHTKVCVPTTVSNTAWRHVQSGKMGNWKIRQARWGGRIGGGNADKSLDARMENSITFGRSKWEKSLSKLEVCLHVCFSILGQEE